MSTPEVRADLARQQALLVEALVSGGERPVGFDAARLELAARSLLNKRLRETARAWPALVRCLSDGYAERFRAYAGGTPPPTEGGPLADGRAFARTLPPALVDDEARAEVLLVDLNWRRTANGLRPRRGVTLKAAWLRRRLVLGVRLPRLGVRLVSLGFTSP